MEAKPTTTTSASRRTLVVSVSAAGENYGGPTCALVNLSPKEALRYLRWCRKVTSMRKEGFDICALVGWDYTPTWLDGNGGSQVESALSPEELATFEGAHVVLLKSELEIEDLEDSTRMASERVTAWEDGIVFSAYEKHGDVELETTRIPLDILLDIVGVHETDYAKVMSTDGTWCLHWVALGEGRDGEFDPADPRDTELLRADLYRGDNEEEPVCSACTLLPAGTSPEKIVRISNVLFKMLRGSDSPRAVFGAWTWRTMPRHDEP